VLPRKETDLLCGIISKQRNKGGIKVILEGQHSKLDFAQAEKSLFQ
jgi:hypothetical protein